MKILFPLIILFSFFSNLSSNDTLKTDNMKVQDSSNVRKLIREMYFGYGLNLQKENINLFAFGLILYDSLDKNINFIMDANNILLNYQKNHYFASSICPGISIKRYLYNEIFVNFNSNIGLTYLSMSNHFSWSYFTFTGLIRFGIKYWRITMDISLQHFLKRQASLSPLTLNIGFNYEGIF